MMKFDKVLRSAIQRFSKLKFSGVMFSTTTARCSLQPRLRTSHDLHPDCYKATSFLKTCEAVIDLTTAPSSMCRVCLVLSFDP